MEIWTICNKAILLIYVVIISYSEKAEAPWYIAFFLLYLCVNLSIYIFKKSLPKQLFMALALLVIIVCCYAINPLFGLLLPVNLYELASWNKIKSSFVFIIMLFPLLTINHDLISLYGLISVLCFMIFAMGRKYTARLEICEETIEKMRGDLQKLTRSLNENNEYLRQSEYTFKLEERNRLSQEIHDKIGHSMTGALIQMEASKRLMETDQKKATELLLNAIHIS